MIQKLYSWYGKRTVWAIGGLIIVLLGVGVYILFKGPGKEEQQAVAEKPSVEVKAVSEMTTSANISTVGTVTAISEAKLKTEAGGRVTTVNTEIGQSIRAGSIIAMIENSREAAAVLQAQGSYEAALAGAEQSDSGVRDAQTRLKAAEDASLSAVRAAYTTANRALLTTIDQFFSNPDSQVPGVRIDGAEVTFLNSSRVALQTTMPSWQSNVDSARTAELSSRFSEAETNLKQLIAIVDSLISATGKAGNSELLLGAPVSTYSAGLLNERSALNAALASVQSARSELEAAKEGLNRAEIGGTGSGVSLANAQVKIALGSLRAAQANYEKTLVRSPISGTVNALYLKEGDYVNPSQDAAIVANNNGLEVSTSVSEEDSAAIKVGDEVTLEGSEKGVVTAIADAVDPTTGKVAVKISVEGESKLTNGTTVTVSFIKKTESEKAEAIIIPLTAIKMTGAGPVAFKVSGDNKLETITLTLGPVEGESVTVTEGLSLDTRIVADARGLKEGEEVDVTAN